MSDIPPDYWSTLHGVVHVSADILTPFASMEEGCAALEEAATVLQRHRDSDRALEHLFNVAGIAVRLIHDRCVRSAGGRRLMPLVGDEARS
ncbi:hypothetical protein [Nocardia farcinica]|uniref:hypothetical protein n=1 Tax=Nocardia farcinica TaxID=37329 RepID=UPI002454266E|nr:hypothetical protein [Nocardia farcinica]